MVLRVRYLLFLQQALTVTRLRRSHALALEIRLLTHCARAVGDLLRFDHRGQPPRPEDRSF